ncbi:MAG: O-antigen ligase family protein [Colwellia sp.]
MPIMTNQNKIYQRLIVFALVISTFTSLRFSFLGIGELIFLALGGIALLQLWNMFRSRYFVFSVFWFYYLLLAIIGGLYNRAAFLNTGTLLGAIFDFSAYFMLFISCLSIERRFVLYNDNAYFYIRSIFCFFVGILSLLYFLSFFTPSIAGFPIRYYQFFAPLVNNLHQTAMMLTPMPFIGMLLLSREKKKMLKVIIVLFIILSVFMINATGSSKAMLGVLLGIIGYLIAKIHQYKVEYSVVASAVIVCFILFGFIVYIDLFSFVMILFNQHDGHGERAYLYSAAIELIKESWILGRGPGGHILLLNEFNDSHQTLLTILLQVGIIGFLLFLRLLYQFLKKAFHFEPSVFAAALSIMAYMAGGDILRRLPIWGVIIILYYVSCQSQTNQQQREHL